VGDEQQRLAAGGRVGLDLEGVREVLAGLRELLLPHQLLTLGERLGRRELEQGILAAVRTAAAARAQPRGDGDQEKGEGHAKPGLTDITSTWSRAGRQSATCDTGVAGLSTAPARAPAARMRASSRSRWAVASTCTDTHDAPAAR